LPKITFVLLLIKFYLVLNPLIVYASLSSLFYFLGVASIVVGTFGALYEIKIKRLLAYASIVHMGYIILGLSINSTEGVIAVIFYIVVYVLMSIYVFAILVGAGQVSPNAKLTFISDLAKSLNQFLAVNFAVLFLSMAGVPPFAGFYPKWYIFLALLNSNNYLMVIFIVLMSVLSAVYYIR
jgi:NADH-quinone oxidoreductase subunit N